MIEMGEGFTFGFFFALYLASLYLVFLPYLKLFIYSMKHQTLNGLKQDVYTFKNNYYEDSGKVTRML